MSKLKAKRELAGLSQADLARISGVSIRMIQYYEQGYKDINKSAVETMKKLADALNCLIEDLIEEEQANGNL